MDLRLVSERRMILRSCLTWGSTQVSNGIDRPNTPRSLKNLRHSLKNTAGGLQLAESQLD